MAKKPKNGLTRGKAGYAVNFFRSDILVNLQLDLKRQEKHGIDETTCSHIRFLLSSLVSAASAEPKASPSRKPSSVGLDRENVGHFAHRWSPCDHP